MNTRILTLLIFILLSCSISAQDKRAVFQTTVQGGLLEGEIGSSYHLNAINGIRYRTWSTGIGVGLDYYHTRSIPLFLDFKKSIFTRERSPFLFMSGGYHFLWDKEDPNNYWGSTVENKGGLYYSGGIGYQFPLNRTSLFFAAGYSYKEFSKEISQPVYCITWPCPEYKQTFDYHVRRLTIMTGLRF